MQIPAFEYMRWAKEHSGVHRYDLTASAAPPLPLRAIESPHVRRQSPSGDGDRVNEALVSARYGVPREHVLFVPGSTLGNYLLVSALIEPGDRVLVENPAYENLPGLVRLLGGRVIDLPRPAAAGHAIDLDAAERGLREGARLVFLTDLHNPTGARLASGDLDILVTLADRYGARILMDEVYRDFLPGAPGTAYREGGPVVVATSLTKVYGLGALRVGWVLAPPAVRERVARLLDYLTVLPPAPAAAAAEQALREADERQDAARRSTEAGRRLFEQWVRKRDDVRIEMPGAGVVAFPGFDGIADTTPLCRWLRAERETAVVPGRFFGDPSRIRLAAGTSAEVLGPGLERLAEGIERHR